MAVATLLLPPRRRLSGQPLPQDVAQALGRGDRLTTGEAGERAQLLRHFELLPRGWPVAALTRSLDTGDADDVAQSAWLRADPAYVRPEISGARLLACGESLQLTREDSDALLPALRPLFGDSGFPLDAPVPGRWYLRLPRGAKLPQFAAPADALGADLFEQLPGVGDDDAGTLPEDARPEGRRWRALLSEAQVVLHNHPHNAARIAAGKPPVNSLWFWGSGAMPDHVSTRQAAVQSDDGLLQALALAAGVPAAASTAAFAAPDRDSLFDLRALRDPAHLHAHWLQPALVALRQGTLDRLLLDCEDGVGFVLARGQRWRFWRKPLAALDA